MDQKNILIIGGGAAGLAAAVELARADVHVDIVDKSFFPGGHGIQFACKATENCVKCGACVVEEKLGCAVEADNIRIWAHSRVQSVTRKGRFLATVETQPVFIDWGKCTDCGVCLQACPDQGMILKGYSRHHSPFLAIEPERCRHRQDPSCSACRDACPEGAIDLDRTGSTSELAADAVVAAAGFAPFDPKSKPYGYRKFDNVITTLELDRMLRRGSRAIRPSDQKAPGRIAFVQCVGSRDAKLNHLWCSRVCCGAALRSARLIQSRQPGTEITCFYIDIQTFGKDFDQFYSTAQNHIRFVRAIPGDMFEQPDGSLKVICMDHQSRQPREEIFDLVVLSIGLTPCAETPDISEQLGLPLADTGFVEPSGAGEGVFAAGTVKGPMTIAETVADAGNTAWNIIKYLGC